jgi:predicted component of type VI protein secretion system
LFLNCAAVPDRLAAGDRPPMLLIQLYNAGAPVREVRAAGPTISLGRDEQSTLVLEDPTKHISRRHATIERVDGAWFLTVHSRVNPVLVDGRVMRTGDTVQLGDAARVTMSPYELTIGILDEAVGADGPSPAGGLDALQVAGAEAPAAPAVEARARAAGRPGGQATNAAEAFLHGMGLAQVRIAADDEAVFLEQAGQVMRAVVEAMVDLLNARADLKRGLQAEDPTMLAARNDNPLKMMSDASQALGYLFDPALQPPGFLPPVQAVKDAGQDLRAHQLALVAGMRAAVLGSIRRFDPEVFEKAAAKAAGPLAINRRARAWEAFVDTHAQLDRDAAESIDRVLQRDFLRAYSEEMRLLTR